MTGTVYAALTEPYKLYSQDQVADGKTRLYSSFTFPSHLI